MIVTSRISVYEIELDVSRWKFLYTEQVPRFYEMLLDQIPSLAQHKCISGRAGGFVEEMKKGTDFAHVIEHVLLEMEHLADPEKKTYRGWTRKKGKRGHTYIIHYGARNYLTGRLAAILAVDLVKKLARQEAVDAAQCIEWLKAPLDYFTSDRAGEISVAQFEEPLSIIETFKGQTHGLGPLQYAERGREECVSLTVPQQGNIRAVLGRIQKHFSSIEDSWAANFVEYGGEFARMILDKLQLLNINHFIDPLAKGEFDKFYRAITSASLIIRSYRIPVIFARHSLWLYKNGLLKYIIQEYSAEAVLKQAIRDFEDFFQIILRIVVSVMRESESTTPVGKMGEVRQFKEIQEGQKSILVVDDDEMIRKIGRDILENHGYSVILAKDGREAVNIYREQGQAISMVVLDMVMPELGGRQACELIRQLNPDAKVLISTGYPLKDEDRTLIFDIHTDLIRKPFTMKDLLHKVETLLQK